MYAYHQEDTDTEDYMDEIIGRGVHSSTSQLNLSRFW